MIICTRTVPDTNTNTSASFKAGERVRKFLPDLIPRAFLVNTLAHRVPFQTGSEKIRFARADVSLPFWTGEQVEGHLGERFGFGRDQRRAKLAELDEPGGEVLVREPVGLDEAWE